MDNARNARLWRTALLYGDRDLFFALQSAEIDRHAERARSAGLIPAVRLDGTSDLGQARRYAKWFSAAHFYDYTKSVKRALESVVSPWHVTYSHHGNRDDTLAVLRAGGSVAAVFASDRKSDPLPESYFAAICSLMLKRSQGTPTVCRREA